ncbi:TetR family transcriptional regulator [Gordonia sp. ABSL49_1]|uniref:acyl-CoA-like ligand-binding transcription factor n=1 Tax=unclassified Gordonia (in: high G+C Gram-positive bacteria) TaxID=2657482 RepID=UPI001F0FE470|nr:TetR family transcriptional regulator [Gordonia sp. ABSL49_1]MCH5645188.1 TetR family transcriptional regulator [Gordonia sp. ABSL49_1]
MSEQMAARVADAAHGVDRGGRPSSTSAHELAAAAQRLFLRDGFDETSVEDIAAAVGVSRRTFFRYFSAKADVVWVETDAELAAFRRLLTESDPADDPSEVVARAFISSIDHGRAEDEWARHRAELILRAPAVQAQANGVYRQWRSAIAQFVAHRRGERPDSRYPVAVAHAAMAASMAGHELWLTDPDADLASSLSAMFELMVPRPTAAG